MTGITVGRKPLQESLPQDKTEFIVIDAAMLEGMRGGPLVDANGHMLGMNALICPDFGGLGKLCREHHGNPILSRKSYVEDDNDNGYSLFFDYYYYYYYYQEQQVITWTNEHVLKGS
jgi:hypothetical protein